VKEYPSVVLVSRDKILIELFGDAYLEYGEGHIIGRQRMWEVIAEHLHGGCTKLILDCWNDNPIQRRDMADYLRKLGVEVVEAWYFITPLDVCRQWFLGDFVPRKMGNIEGQKIMRKMKELSYNRCYENYHAEPVELEQGFDVIHRINPLESPPLGILFQPLPQRVSVESK